MVQLAQSEQKYVTDGSHTYHYNDHLAELVARGDLKYCDRPLKPQPRKPNFPQTPNEPMMEEVQRQLAGGLDADADDDKDGNGQPAS